jgi:hypothetical protein
VGLDGHRTRDRSLNSKWWLKDSRQCLRRVFPLGSLPPQLFKVWQENFPRWLGLECSLKSNTMSHTLALLFLIATGVWATCYRPGGFAADYRYVPCHDGKPSMCCRTNDPNYPDVCRADSLCQETLQDVVWRESCTDPSWQAPECLRLCLGKHNAAPSCCLFGAWFLHKE